MAVAGTTNRPVLETLFTNSVLVVTIATVPAVSALTEDVRKNAAAIPKSRISETKMKMRFRGFIERSRCSVFSACKSLQRADRSIRQSSRPLFRSEERSDFHSVNFLDTSRGLGQYRSQ